MIQQIRTAVTMLVALTMLTGIVYPLTVTVIAQVMFSDEANGSLIHDGEKVVGSTLIGQPFSRPEYFWGRLSATSSVPYNAAASSGSNFGPLHPELKKAALQRIADLQTQAPSGGGVPVDLVTSSASGLDPHISPAAAEFQVPRIAIARGISENEIRGIVRQHTKGRQLGFLGEPRVNVLELNIALDQQRNRQ